jgi:hypothetical protein
MIKFSSGVSQTDETVTVNGHIDLTKTQNLMTVVAHEYKGLRVTAYPGRALLIGSRRYMVHWTKYGDAAPRQNLDAELFRQFLWIPKSF